MKTHLIRVPIRLMYSVWSACLRISHSPACLAVALSILVFLPGGVEAAPGDLDPRFSRDGKVTSDFVPDQEAIHGPEEATDVAIQPDGKIVAVGRFVDPADFDGNGDEDRFLVGRFKTDGGPDPTFGAGGKIRLDVDGDPSNFDRHFAHAVALQKDAKIVVAGASHGNFTLARLNGDGSLDSSFGNAGIVITSFNEVGGTPPIEASVNALALQRDGKVLAVGVAGPSTGTVRVPVLARYLRNGAIDTSFGNGGKVILANIRGGLSDAAIQGNGKIVAVGFSRRGFVTLRFRQDGAMDTGFGANGRVFEAFSGSSALPEALALQANGRIVVAGQVLRKGKTQFALVRYLANGRRDTGFSGDGRVTTDFGRSRAEASDVAIQRDGKVVAVGSTRTSRFRIEFAVARYQANGMLDGSFGNQGKVITKFATVDGSDANAVALQKDGKIVVVGGASRSGNSTFGLARYLAK